ncbi:PIG-L deacetylase family protein [Klenkia terrae]|uniref:PIG-L deacetylase family protein n=1 Tax=Klenkia terrae TaxID=1052259 RepID=UPI001CD85199|nr:PIG-L family deacetylase [Klenkia terrae]
MLALLPADLGRPLRVLAVGAHPDDVEIGAGGTLLQLVDQRPDTEVDVLVLTGTAERAAEARAAADLFLAGARHTVTVHDLPDGRLPAHWDAVKQVLEDHAAAAPRPDLVIGPGPDDSHQDHRLIAELLPTVFRGVLTLGYEIPKWDGDLGRRPVYVALDPATARRKAELLAASYPSQRGRAWYDDEVFLGLARLRGVECSSSYAEAFSCAKAVLAFAPTTPERPGA